MHLLQGFTLKHSRCVFFAHCYYSWLCKSQSHGNVTFKQTSDFWLFRNELGIRHLFIPGPGQHIIDDEGPNIHVKPGDILTINNPRQDALKAIPWFIIKRVW